MKYLNVLSKHIEKMIEIFNKSGMRAKIFVFVAILFGITILGVIALRYWEVNRSILGATNDIAQFVKKLDQEKRKAIVEYLASSVTEKEDQINALFKRINEFSRVNNWKEASLLMMTNQWIDLIQTTNRGKLTASIVARPTYLEDFICIPVNELLSVVVTVNHKKELIAYIAVPWEKDQLLFSLKGFLEIKPLMKSIRIVQEELKNHAELMSILTSQKLLNTWVEEKTNLSLKEIVQSEDLCDSYICKQAESKNNVIHQGWNSRYQQNTFIWKLGEFAGIGNDPLEEGAPKGICSFLQKDVGRKLPFYRGRGILACEVFRKEPLSIVYECSIFDENVCISKDLDVMVIPDKGGVFLTNTMVYQMWDKTEKKLVYGTVTLGMGFNKELERLALVVPGSLLFVTESGDQLFFNKNGEVSNIPMWQGIDFSKLVTEKTGVIKDIEGNEFLFLHLTPTVQNKGHVFVIELRQNVFQMLLSLKVETSKLMHKLLLENSLLGCIALIVGLIILNQILKKGIAPLTALATTTKMVAMGQWEKIRISESWKRRKDEVGVLCVAFDQMIAEMREGLKVRALLNKVVSKEIVEKILKDGVQLGGETREVTILFADIRHFTQITETMDPKEVLDMLNSCLTVLSRVVDDYGGVIDKYIGDEIMVIFGAPVDTPNAAFQAVMCAKTMIEVLTEWNEMRKARNLCTLSIGISIHTGPVVAGNTGAENHLSYTVLGHTANLAARIVDQAQEMEILITESTLKAPNVSENIHVKPLPPIQFKGITSPISLYKVLY